MKFGTVWRTIVAWGGGILLTLVMIPPGLIILALDPVKQRLVTPMVVFWARTIIKLCFIPITVEGRENLKGTGSAVFVTNHQSLMDIFLLLAYPGRRIGYLAKKQTLWIPVIGLLMLILGHIFVDRSNPRSSLRSIQKCIGAVRRGRSIAIFPEGTRTLDGDMLPFKSGSMKIPLRTGAPVVPVTICGTFNVMPKNTFGVRPRPIYLHFGKPIETAGIDKSNFREFVARMERTIRETKRDIELRHPEVASGTLSKLTAA
jgi:1-acyl-sn-glycerol-3-phosphate acyltransferase